MCDQVYLSKSTRPLRAAVLHTDGQKLFGKKGEKNEISIIEQTVICKRGVDTLS